MTMTALRVSNAASIITWQPEARVAHVQYTEGATLQAEDGVLLVEALGAWIGVQTQPFGVLANAKGLKATTGAYRSRVGDYFKQHPEAHIAMVNMGPVIRIVVDMFRIGTGVSLKAFGGEEDARSWLRSCGIAI